MPALRASRFFSDPVLEKCLAGQSVVRGNADPLGHVARIQQALNDAGCTPFLKIDGLFGDNTETAVNDYKLKRGILPRDGKVDAAMMTRLDEEYAHSLADAAAKAAPPEFVPGDRQPLPDVTGERSRYQFQNGTVVQSANVVAAYAPPPAAAAAAAASAAADFGTQIGLLTRLGSSAWVTEYENATFIITSLFEDGFAVPRDFWEASVSGFDLIGLPTRGLEESGVPGGRVLPHEHGVVLGFPDVIPQALPTAVYDEWKARHGTPQELGPPAAFAFTGADGHPVFPFWYGMLPDDGGGTA